MRKLTHPASSTNPLQKQSFKISWEFDPWVRCKPHWCGQEKLGLLRNHLVALQTHLTWKMITVRFQVQCTSQASQQIDILNSEGWDHHRSKRLNTNYVKHAFDVTCLPQDLDRLAVAGEKIHFRQENCTQIVGLGVARDWIRLEDLCSQALQWVDVVAKRYR